MASSLAVSVIATSFLAISFRVARFLATSYLAVSVIAASFLAASSLEPGIPSQAPVRASGQTPLETVQDNRSLQAPLPQTKEPLLPIILLVHTSISLAVKPSSPEEKLRARGDGSEPT